MKRYLHIFFKTKISILPKIPKYDVLTQITNSCIFALIANKEFTIILDTHENHYCFLYNILRT